MHFPEDQRASAVEQSLESLILPHVAHALSPEMTYPGWKSVRSAFGKACLTERKRRSKLSALCTWRSLCSGVAGTGRTLAEAPGGRTWRFTGSW